MVCATEDFSPWPKPMRRVWRSSVAQSPGYPTLPQWWSTKECRAVHFAEGAARRMAKSDHLRGSTLDLLLGFTPLDHSPTKANGCDLPSTICPGCASF